MPFCTQCGVENPAAARFCDQCGAPLVQVTNAPAAVAVPTMAAPIAPTAPAAPAPVAQPAISAGPTVCPQCGTAAIPGEAFCDNCGAPLSAPQRPPVAVPTPPYSPGLTPQPTYPPPQPAQPTQPAAPPSYGAAPAAPPSYAQPAQPVQPAYTPPPAPPVQPAYTPPAQPARTALAPARLVAVATGAAMALPATAQAIIGRADPVSQFRPDLDLTAYGALEQGVGRRHVRLFVQDNQIMVEDMDSTNGTQINGQRLPPRQPKALRDGDQLQLGRLVLRIQL